MTETSKQAFSIFHDSRVDDLRNWHRPYAEFLDGCTCVLDIGSGLMYFGELLREKGVEVVGLDIDPAMVQAGAAKGFKVIEGDHHALKSLGLMVDAVHISHVVEHLWGEELIDLLQSCIACLRPGGLIVIRTPNWSVRFVREHLFWMDHTHKRPYPRQLLVKILHDLGLKEVCSGEEPYLMRDLYVIAQLPGGAGRNIKPLRFDPPPTRPLHVKILSRVKTYCRRFLELE